MTFRPTAAVAALAIVALTAATMTGCGIGQRRDRDGASYPVASPDPSAEAGAEDWPNVTPARAGMDAAVLTRLTDQAGQHDSTCFAVARDNKVVVNSTFDGVPSDQPREVHSVTKSVTSALVGIALGDGLLRLDDPVSRFVPSLAGTDSATVTIADLLSNDSGRWWSKRSDYWQLLRADDQTAFAESLGQQHPPGTVWTYNNAAIQLLDAVLRAATGEPTGEFAAERLFAPLGMTHTSMAVTGDGGTSVFNGLQSTCADLLRFGSLYLDHGRYRGQQILDPGFVTASLRPSTSLNDAYGYLWWLNTPGSIIAPDQVVDGAQASEPAVPGQMVPGAPQTMFAALGFGSQVLLVDPGSRVIAVRLGDSGLRSDDDFGVDQVARVVTEAVH